MVAFPSALEFRSVQPGTTYTSVVRLQNASAVSRRVRIAPLRRTSGFACAFDR
jgi:hypothetical protein